MGLVDEPKLWIVDEKKLGRLARCTPERWGELSPTILSAFQKEGDRWVQKRLRFEWEKIEKLKKKYSKNGKKGAEKRWDNKGLNSQAIVDCQGELEIELELDNINTLEEPPLLVAPEGVGGGEVKKDGRVRKIVDHYAKKFLEKTKNPWHVNGGKVGALTKKLLSTYKTEEKVVELIDDFFSLPDRDFVGQAGRDFGVFYSQVNKLKSTRQTGGANVGTKSSTGGRSIPGLMRLRNANYGKGF